MIQWQAVMCCSASTRIKKLAIVILQDYNCVPHNSNKASLEELLEQLKNLFDVSKR